MKTTRCRAVVLRRTNYGEADRIVELLTPNGRNTVMARGVRKEKSKLAGGIELFAICDVVIGEGKGDINVLTSARIMTFFSNILTDFERMQFAYEVLAQVAKASASLNTPDWFDIIVEVFQALNNPVIPIKLVQTWFYVRIAKILGEELNTIYECGGFRLSADNFYSYDVREKGFRLHEKGNVCQEHIKILRLCSIKELDVVAQVGGMNDYLDTCLMVARQHAAL